MYDHFTRRLRAYRKLKQLTQQDLAARLGLSVSAVGGMERGTRVPTDDELHRIMALLDVTRTDLGLDP